MMVPEPPDPDLASQHPGESETLLPSDASIAARLIALESLLTDGSSVSIETVLREVEHIKGDLQLALPLSSTRSTELLVGALTAQAHAERVSALNAKAVSTYDDALRALSQTPPGKSRERQSANLWTCRGLSLLSIHDVSSLENAVESFDRAISLRTRMEVADKTDRWGLAAAWLNRGDALAGLGGATFLQEAMLSTEKAREALVDFDPDNNPSYRTRWALSWMKQGEFAARLFHEHGVGSRESIDLSYDEAISILRPGVESGFEESRRILAAALSNRSRTRLLLDETGSIEGEDEAREALTWLEASESSCPEMVALGATARIALGCHLESTLLEKERFIEITDLAEEGLKITSKARRNFGFKTVDSRLLGELTRLGAEAYFHAAPHFLTEFLLDLLDPERNQHHFADVAAVHEVAVRVLWKGIAEIKREGFTGMGSPAFNSRLDLLSDMEQCRERLSEIRNNYFEL